MSRDTVDAAVETELEADKYIPLYLVELDFPSAPVYAHSGVGDYDFNGHTFTGVGDLGGISPIEETADLQSNGLTLSLSGVNPALVSISLNDHIQGRSANLYIGFLDDDHKLIAGPVGPFSGRMDVMGAEIGKTATLQLTVESRLVDWERPRIRRYTDADQQAEYPGDKFFEFVSEMQELELKWGPQ